MVVSFFFVLVDGLKETPYQFNFSRQDNSTITPKEEALWKCRA
jgi:hypothetical protein